MHLRVIRYVGDLSFSTESGHCDFLGVFLLSERHHLLFMGLSSVLVCRRCCVLVLPS